VGPVGREEEKGDGAGRCCCPAGLDNGPREDGPRGKEGGAGWARIRERER